MREIEQKIHYVKYETINSSDKNSASVGDFDSSGCVYVFVVNLDKVDCA